MKTTYNTFLPCFPGFYNSFLYYDDMDIQAAEDCISIFGSWRELNPGLIEEILNISGWNFECDFESYKNTCAVRFCKAVTEKLNDIFYFNPVLDVDDPGFVIKFEKVISPRFYNYETDSVNCTIEFDPEIAIVYCKKHIDAFAEYLRERYTSRSGFISYYSHNVKDWLNPEEWSEHHAGSILEFILLNEDRDAEYHLSLDVLENVYLAEYYDVPEKLKELFENPAVKEIAEEFNSGDKDANTAAKEILSFAE